MAVHLITCMIVMVLISTMAVAMAGISGANLQIADNQREANRAFANAESGLEVMRYWLSRVRMPSSTPETEYLSKVVADVQADLLASDVTNFVVNTDGSIPPVVLDAATGQSFQGQWSWHASDPTILRITVTGTSGRGVPDHHREFQHRSVPVPDLQLRHGHQRPVGAPAQSQIPGRHRRAGRRTSTSRAPAALIAVDIGGNATFAGNIDIGNPLASVSTGGTLNIGGTIQTLDAEDRPEFPVPDVERLPHVRHGTRHRPDHRHQRCDRDADQCGSRRRHGPHVHAANVIIQGILYIEAPNVVTFATNTTVQGMIVAEGDVNNPGTNQINFGDPATPKVPSNFSSGPYPAGALFDALREEEGSCILAPGFTVSFWKNFAGDQRRHRGQRSAFRQERQRHRQRNLDQLLGRRRPTSTATSP